MNRKMFYVVVILALVIMLSERSESVDLSNLADQSSYRCPGGIVAVGDLDRTIQNKCGDPIEVTRRMTDSYDIWIYHFGQSKFMHYFGFLNGKLQRIVAAPCKVDDPACFDLR
ncbi:MAG: DUF2845 domain-containing protein [Desulfobacterales bacterium]|nr:MAG: DUF2845 domain-containing protein [Desulfobacterales bacterium]